MRLAARADHGHPNPISAADLAGQVADLAETTTGVLLLYYVGHGVLSARGELCLTVTSTRPNRPKISGLPWDTLADVLRACPARIRLAILDCCFAGQAIEALGGDGDPGLADITHVDGVYTLTATTRNRTAHVPPPDQQDTACTSFTGELRDLIRSGIPGKPPRLTFGDIYPVLRQRLRAKGLPAPSQRGTDTAHQFPFTANAAARLGPDARARAAGNGAGEPVQKNPDPVRPTEHGATRILTDALAHRPVDHRRGHEGTGAGRASRRRWPPPTRPRRPAHRRRRTHRPVDHRRGLEGIGAGHRRGGAGRHRPDRAERIAQSITDEH